MPINERNSVSRSDVRVRNANFFTISILSPLCCHTSSFLGASRVAAHIGDVMSAPLFILLLMYAVIVAVCMVALESAQSIDVALMATIVGVQMSIYCYLSENVTSDLEKSGAPFYESHWYNLPTEYQKFYILSIKQPQKLYRLTGLGIIECSLRILASVSCLLI